MSLRSKYMYLPVPTQHLDYTHIYPDLFTSVPSKSAAVFLRVSAFSLPERCKINQFRKAF